MSARKRLAALKRNRNKIVNALKRAPRAPPQLGPLGQAYNVLRRAPEPFVDAASIAFNNRLLLEAAARAENQAIAGQRPIAGPIITESLREVTPNLDQVQELVMAATDEELLDEELVNEIVKEIEMINSAVQTGRDVIRGSGQFDRQNLLPRFSDPPKRTRKKTKTDKNMSKALTEANEKLRTKKGKLRKGKSQSDVMTLAHKLLKKM